MRVIPARIVDGKIDVGDDAELEEGVAVAVLIAERPDFSLSNAEAEELEVALAEIRRGEHTDGHELLRELKGLTFFH